MFNAENEDVLVTFKSLCEQYPRENVVALWEMAGGQVAAQQLRAADEWQCAACKEANVGFDDCCINLRTPPTRR